MEFAKYAIFSVLLASVLSCAQVSCDDKDPTMTKKEPEICDGDKDEESSCGCGGGATNRVHSKTDDKEEATVEVVDEAEEKEKEVDMEAKNSGGSKYTAAANAKSNYPRTHQMVEIEGGNFVMGTDKPIIYMDGEHPARKVTINSFWIDVHEVSNAEFELFVNSTGYVTEVCIVDFIGNILHVHEV